MLYQKIHGPKIIWGPKWFGVQLILGPKNLRGATKFGTKKIFGPKKCWVQKNVWSKKSWAQKMLDPKNVGSKKFWVQTNFETFRHLLCTPIHPHKSDTFQTHSRRIFGTLQTYSRHPPNFSFLRSIKLCFATRAGGGWVSGWFLLHNHATSWSNL